MGVTNYLEFHYRGKPMGTSMMQIIKLGGCSKHEKRLMRTQSMPTCSSTVPPGKLSWTQYLGAFSQDRSCTSSMEL